MGNHHHTHIRNIPRHLRTEGERAMRDEVPEVRNTTDTEHRDHAAILARIAATVLANTHQRRMNTALKNRFHHPRRQKHCGSFRSAAWKKSAAT